MMIERKIDFLLELITTTIVSESLECGMKTVGREIDMI